jgi:hypothetical protein
MNQEFLGEEVIDSDEDIETGNEEGMDEEPTSSKKSNSNFKALYKAKKELETQLSDKDQKLADALAELEEWRNLNPEYSEDLKSNKKVSTLEQDIFVLKNPDAEPHIKAIKETMDEYNCDFKKAWKLVKVDLPEESKTTKEFSLNNKVNLKKDLSKITPEEAMELPKDKRREWRKVHGYQ